MCEKETNESEPLMRRQDAYGVVKTLERRYLEDKSESYPVFCSGGNWRRDGVNFSTGVEREQENLAYDSKGEFRSGSSP